MFSKPVIRMLVTDRRSCSQPLFSYLPRAVRAFEIDAVLLREKDLDRSALTTLARSLMPGLTCPVILRAPPLWATEVSAYGSHCDTPDALSFLREENRREALLGTSVHSCEAALAAEALGFDYAIFGPVLDTIKGGLRVRGVGLRALEEVCRTVRLPILAIGGMNFDSESAVVRAGARGWAAIRCFLPEELG